MNIHLLSVTNKGSASKPCPGIYFSGKWLSDTGFIPGALVKVIPGRERMTFTLCDDIIGNYSNLDSTVRELGGKLIQVSYTYGKKSPYPHLTASGQYLQYAGLDFGDALIAYYSQGLIQVCKLPGEAKVVHITSIKDQRTGKLSPRIQLYGGWLTGIGFTPDTLATVSSEPGRITVRLRDESIESYSALVRFARQNKMKLVQAREVTARGRSYPCIATSGSSIDKAGFVPGDMLLAYCGYGLINIQKYDFEGLGF